MTATSPDVDHDSWEPLEPFCCPRCDGFDWHSEPRWREATAEETSRYGWRLVPERVPQRSTCLTCGLTATFGEAA